jgi:glycosyltransferase involved in cell wall biosynthesis
MNQTWSDYELIIVNDGSTDETKNILKRYRQRYDFQVVHQENLKLPRALNTGFGLARGEYLTWTSSDNVMLPNMLQVLADALDQNPQVGLVYADWEVINERGETQGVVRTLDYDRHLLLKMNYINACFLYRRSCQDKVGFYDPAFLYAEDWEYWLRISRYYKMMRVPQELYQFRVHSKSLTTTQVLSHSKDSFERYQKLIKHFKIRPWTRLYAKLKWEILRLKLGRDPSPALELSESRENSKIGMRN